MEKGGCNELRDYGTWFVGGRDRTRSEQLSKQHCSDSKRQPARLLGSLRGTIVLSLHSQREKGSFQLAKSTNSGRLQQCELIKT